MKWIRALPKIAFRLNKEHITRLKEFQRSPVSNVKLHLIKAYGLESVYKYVKGSSAFEKEGFSSAQSWKSQRGRPKALKLALNWLGINDFELIERGYDRRWNCYQIGLPEKVDKEFLSKIRGVSELSSPARATLERVYLIKSNNKCLTLSGSNSTLSSGAVLSTDSGVVSKEGFVNDIC